MIFAENTRWLIKAECMHNLKHSGKCIELLESHSMIRRKKKEETKMFKDPE